MLDQNVLSLAAIHPEGRGSRKIELPPKTSSESDVFASAILDETTTHRKRPLDLAISLGLHTGLLVFVLLLPLFFSSGLDLHKTTTTFLVAPLPPSAPPPTPPEAATPRVVRAAPKQIIASGKLTAPSFVPRKVAVIADDAAPVPDQAMAGVVGGLPGGIAGGPIGSLVNVDASIPAAPKPVAEGPKKPLRVGGAVTAPRIIYAPAPEYPILARQSHVSGTVVIEAVIDEHGSVIEARAVSGNGLLIAAALKAVSQRKYEPTILDGEATPVALRVEVNFHG
jgi:periplasmic protein TonB